MRHLFQEAKQAIIKKVLNDKSKTQQEWAQLNNVGLSTLNKWLKAYRIDKQNNDSYRSVAKNQLPILNVLII